MAAKQVLFRSAAREKVLRGGTQLADAVRITLGPRSKSVLIQKKWGAPIVCNDGVTIAKEMELEDPEENLGVQMLQAGRRKDRRRRWRRHEHGDDPRARDLCGRRAQRRRGCECHRSQARTGSRPRSRGEGSQGTCEARQQPQGESPGRDDLRAQRSRDRRARCGCNGEGRRRRRDHCGGVEDDRDDARGRRRAAVRSRLSVALFRHRHRQHGGGPRGRLRPHLRSQAQHPQGHHPAARAGGQVRTPDPHHRGGHRGRGARNADRESDPRRAEERGGEGARLR